MSLTIHNEDLEQARTKVRGALRTTRWLRRITILLALAIAVLVMAIRLNG